MIAARGAHPRHALRQEHGVFMGQRIRFAVGMHSIRVSVGDEAALRERRRRP